MQIRRLWYTLAVQKVCGIAGIWSKANLVPNQMDSLRKAVEIIAHRGPDASGIEGWDKAALGHRRLSIIDTDARANQPMSDPGGRYHIAYNGEVYNYRELSKELSDRYGFEPRSSSDTEVLLHGLIYEGADFLHRVNGFFAFAFYDSAAHELILARDRFGIKPCYFRMSEQGELIFGSKLGCVMAFSQNNQIDRKSLFSYLQLSYIPAPESIISGTSKLAPGELIHCKGERIERKRWYRLETNADKLRSELPVAERFRDLLQDAVHKRIYADVPVGTFLSGGLDSSVISLLAARCKPDIPAFSIGFPEQSFFDESKAARETARHLGLKHHLIEVRARDMEEQLEHILEAIDEPFADSSSVLVNVLSKHARQEVKVALSGDGADELLGGYNKHRALLRSLRRDPINRTLRSTAPALEFLPGSRSNGFFNRMRKLKRYSRGLRLEFGERYLAWASFTRDTRVRALLQAHPNLSLQPSIREKLEGLNPEDFNTVLLTDIALVLPNDMLYKVDSMSMHHALEVRTPFLDHRLVEFISGLPASAKLDTITGKKLLREAFSADFPPGFFERGKKGFEAPLAHWLRGVLSGELERLTATDLLHEQGIFAEKAVARLKRQLKTANPGDAPHTLWAIFIFQHWWEKQVKEGLLNSTSPVL